MVAQLQAVPAPLEVVPPDGQPETFITEEVSVRVRNLLGIKPESWERIMPKVRELLPRYALHKITARVSLNMGFDTLAKLVQTTDVMKGIMEDSRQDPSVRVTAGKMVASAVDSMGKMMPELMKLADSAGDRTAEDDAANGRQPKKPRNLPPQWNLQVNIAAPGAPAAKAGTPIKHLPPVGKG